MTAQPSRLLAAVFAFPSPFRNRNPRNLELLNLRPRDRGSQFSAVRSDHYHRIIFERKGRFLNSKIEHSNGNIVLSASTKEYSIGSFLAKTYSSQAARNLAKILAYRCLQSGIESARFYKTTPEYSEKENIFLESLQKNGIELDEVDVIEQKTIPGVDYDEERREYIEKNKKSDD